MQENRSIVVGESNPGRLLDKSIFNGRDTTDFESMADIKYGRIPTCFDSGAFMYIIPITFDPEAKESSSR